MILDRSVVYLTDVFRGRIEYGMIYSLRDAKTILFIFDETNNDISFIIQRITETKIENQSFLNY